MKIAFIQMFALHLFHTTELSFAQEYIQLKIVELPEEYEKSAIAVPVEKMWKEGLWKVNKVTIINYKKDFYDQYIDLE